MKTILESDNCIFRYLIGIICIKDNKYYLEKIVCEVNETNNDLINKLGFKLIRLLYINQNISNNQNEIIFYYLCEKDNLNYIDLSNLDVCDKVKEYLITPSSDIKLIINGNTKNINTDLDIKGNKEKIRFRACAIIEEKNKLLIVSNKVSPYYYTVGGGIHIMESIKDACLRETFEETGINYEIDKLLIVNENLFMGDNKYEGYKCHEIAFHFLMKKRNTLELNSNSSCLYGEETLTWMDLDKLDSVKFLPNIFNKEMFENPNLRLITTKDY